jgi:hypothetical protein
MEEKYRDIMEELLYQISVDIYNLLEVDYEDAVDEIQTLSRKVEKLSDDIYEDEIVYERSGRADLRFSLT